MRLQFRFALASAVLVLVGLNPARASEFRGLYVDAFHPGFKNHEEVTQMVAAAKAANFNALIVQVRKRGDAYYNSKVERKGYDIAPEYDPLADVIEQAHAQGMEVHAWLSVYEVTLYRGLTEEHITKAHEAWLMADRQGGVKLAHGKIYTDPGVPAVRDHFLSLVREILLNYSADGIHLDNVRYPDKASGYNAISVALFNEQFQRAGVPEDDDADWCSWRCAQVTELVRMVSGLIASLNPEVKLSASVMTAQPGVAADRYLQDWGDWTKDRLVDFVVPMIYITADKMQEYAPQALAAAADRHVYVGIGAYRLPAELSIKHITDARAAGAKGLAIYSYDCLGPNSTEAVCTRLVDLAGSVFAEADTAPAMSWKEEH